MRAAVWIAIAPSLALLAGCDRAFGISSVPPQISCFGSSAALFSLCPDPLSDVPYVLPQDVDTGASPSPCTQLVKQTDAAATEVCVIAASTIDIHGGPIVHGARPLVLIASEAITVAAGTQLDVASHRGGTIGAGEAQAACTAPPATGTYKGGGGGAGGGFHGPGAAGGASFDMPGAPMAQAVAIGVIRAGCPGGDGSPAGGIAGGTGGNGGGALYLMAGERIEIDGAIDASGAGGGGGAAAGPRGGGGGGGGGSGGLIGIDAPMVSISGSGLLVANGGGGGGGGANNTSTPHAGGDGTDALVFGGTYPFAAPGGTAGMPLGGPGGTGANGGSAPSPGTSTIFDGAGYGGGGGGGGAAGYILISGGSLDDTGPMTYSPPHG